MQKLQEKAMLVKLSIGAPGNTRKDKVLTEDIKQQKHLGQKAGRWMKQLYPDEAFAPFAKLDSECRAWHYLHSMPWKDDGWRITTSAAFMQYAEFMRDKQAAYRALVRTHFEPKYQEFIEWAKTQHNGTFNPSEYDLDAAKEKFYFEVEFLPIPEGADFRVAIQNDEAEAIRKDIDEATAKAVTAAHQDLWKKLSKPIQYMVERLKAYEEAQTKRAAGDKVHPRTGEFEDTLVENLQKVVDVLPALDLQGDPVLEAFRKEVEAELIRYNPQTLRDDHVARATVAERAKDIMKRMEGYIA